MAEKKKSVCGLPEDIFFTHIFLRLAAKSLLTCTCVCKSWNSFIKTPAFFSSHLKRSIASYEESDSRLCFHQRSPLPVKTGKDSFLLRSRTQEYSLIEEFHFPYNHKPGFQALASCNGLILLMHGKYGFSSPLGLILWNPSIRKSKTIYDCFYVVGGESKPFLNLKTLEAIGLGFDSRISDYKVVTLTEDRNYAKTLMVNLYSLKTHSWKRLPDVEAVYDGIGANSHKGMIYLNGSLYFVARKGWSKKKRLSILRFDLSDEVFHELLLPHCMDNDAVYHRTYCSSSHCYLFIHEESLAVSWFKKDIRRIQIWVMKEYGVKESWTQLWTVRLPSESLPTPRLISEFGCISGLMFTKDSHVLLSVVGNGMGRIFLHDLKSQETKEISDERELACFFMGDYVESLALLDKGNDLSWRFEIESGTNDDDVYDYDDDDYCYDDDNTPYEYDVSMSESGYVDDDSHSGNSSDEGIAYLEEDLDGGDSSEDSGNEGFQ